MEGFWIVAYFVFVAGQWGEFYQSDLVTLIKYSNGIKEQAGLTIF